ncbi:nicotinamide-nucleotide amidase [uncultured Thiodictyon sp.]|uniref:nicotinamide-nucleotide amidase n=1 Tax=uncultured Thiodictyon sp. TaxID=1846217 RepID=UPI0025D1B68B|nr:nicotinamide-nucleotide amidase [uncultured Thiodictyon sp.]
MTESLDPLAARLGQALLTQGLLLATAESCTGGWIAKVVTDIAGSSAWFDRGFVTYSNAAKTDMLGVRSATLAAHGAVSEAVVLEMAAGTLAHSEAQVAVVVSGIAGPDGGSEDKPVGTVWFAWSVPGAPPWARCLQFVGDRREVRHQAVRLAIEVLLERLAGHGG